MTRSRLDQLPPPAAAALGLTIGAVPLGLVATGHAGIGIATGLGLAAGGWWVARRPGSNHDADGRSDERGPSPFARARTVTTGSVDGSPRVASNDQPPPQPAPAVAPPSAEPPRASRPSRGPADVAAPPNDFRPALVPIHPGEFVMGSPESEAGRNDDEQAHRVKLTRGFLMAETEVTQAQYEALMGRNPSRFRGTEADGDRPVEQVSWLDAVSYCNALSAKEGLAPAYTIQGDTVSWDRGAAGYRLPTEAEWEYAARAGTRTATYAGDLDIAGDNNAPALDSIAWYGGNSGSAHPKAMDSSGWPGKQHPHEKASTQPVKGKRPNPWGLYDMLGNVREWTWDRYAAYPSTAAGAPLVDPAGPPSGVRRVIRGGSFDDYARGVRAADRSTWRPVDRSWWLGFRPVRFAGPPPRAR